MELKYSRKMSLLSIAQTRELVAWVFSHWHCSSSIFLWLRNISWRKTFLLIFIIKNFVDNDIVFRQIHDWKIFQQVVLPRIVLHWTFSWPDSSPTNHFPGRTFPRLPISQSNISPNKYDKIDVLYLFELIRYFINFYYKNPNFNRQKTWVTVSFGYKWNENKLGDNLLQTIVTFWQFIRLLMLNCTIFIIYYISRYHRDTQALMTELCKLKKEIAATV